MSKQGKLILTAEARDCLRRRRYLKRRIYELRRQFFQTKHPGTPEEQDAAYAVWKAARDELRALPTSKDFRAPPPEAERGESPAKPA